MGNSFQQLDKIESEGQENNVIALGVAMTVTGSGHPRVKSGRFFSCWLEVGVLRGSLLFDPIATYRTCVWMLQRDQECLVLATV